MKIKELVDFIKSLVPGRYTFNTFPLESSHNNWIVIKLTSGFPPNEWTGKTQPSFQVRVRGNPEVSGSNEPFDTENKAYEIHKALTNLTNVKIGNLSVVKIRSMNSAPLYIGNDENNRPIYSMNFYMTVRP